MAKRRSGSKHPPRRQGLDVYRAKRDPTATPEPYEDGPSPEQSSEGPFRFVVQKHAATRMHYDLRLEMGGALRSWAVPMGPSANPADKRLAVHTEDHPLNYADFEGVIPEGNYGAGAMIVWDRGEWVPLEAPAEGYDKGNLKFELRGYKLRGAWVLVKTKGDNNEWLLIKKADPWASAEQPFPYSQQSILSGRTVEELREGEDRAQAVRDRLQELGAPRRTVRAQKVDLMLAETADGPFSSEDWLFELKYDGYRLLVARHDGRPFLRYRRGSEATAAFPDIARTAARLPYESIVFDGEVVVLDEQGRPSFQRLQKRVQLQRTRDIERASVELPATFYAFDLLGVEDRDLRSLPLQVRKELLKQVLPTAGPLRYTDHVVARGEELFEQVRRVGLEGLMAKQKESRYRGGRSSSWLKLPVDQTGDFVIVGYSPAKGSRSGFGAVHVAVWERGELVYAGRVGSGFSDAELVALREVLDEMRIAAPAFGGPVSRSGEQVWVEPRLVCEVRYKETTDEGHLRQPVFVRMRSDKAPEDCIRGEAGRDERLAEPPPAVFEVPDPAAERTVPFTNLDKPFWPGEGYTKGDLIEFYRRVSPWLLEYLRDRPVVLTRYPDGIDGKSFFQKDAPAFTPGWVRLERMWSEHAQREIDYFVCDDVESLLYIANLGTIPLHIWSSRVASLDKPDWCILDLDPKGAPFTDVVKVARAIRELCEEIGLPSYPKTSGSTGLHVLIPLGRQMDYGQSRTLAHLMAQVIEQRIPEIATTVRTVGKRGGRVYIDFLQNGHGRLLVSPLCVRPRPGATVSTPLRWREVTARLDPDRYTIDTVPPRLKRMKQDPIRAVLDDEPDLLRALEKLAAQVG